VRWARTPGHDSYWHYGPAFFDTIVPAPAGLTLEVGCGEGRVARDLGSRGHRVVAVDSSRTLIGYAKAADRGGAYLLADAAALPFADGTFQLAVAYNSLMDVEDLGAVVREAARVLSAQGCLCVCVTHPFTDAGRFKGDDGDAPFVVAGSYMAGGQIHERVERDGLEMTFHGRLYPLQDYAIALETAGFAVERLREPAGAEAGVLSQQPWQHGQRMPTFLHLRCRKATLQ
jgi:SAM-dependent methyltransferase